MAVKRTRVFWVRMQLRAENSICTIDAEIDLSRYHHAQHGCDEVEPLGSPDIGKDCRSRGSGRVDAKAGYGSEEEDVQGDQDSDEVAGKVSHRRSVRQPENDSHENRRHKKLREESRCSSISPGHSNGIIDGWIGKTLAQKEC